MPETPITPDDPEIPDEAPLPGLPESEPPAAD